MLVVAVCRHAQLWKQPWAAPHDGVHVKMPATRVPTPERRREAGDQDDRAPQVPKPQRAIHQVGDLRTRRGGDDDGEPEQERVVAPRPDLRGQDDGQRREGDGEPDIVPKFKVMEM